MSNKKCSPKSKNVSNITCFNYNSLKKIANSWNKNRKDKIKIVKNPNKLWEKINKKLHYYCDTELCWLNQPFINNNLKNELKTSFKPKMPKEWKKNPKQWLSTIDIENVMKQYEESHKDFKFIGPVPIDFDSQDRFGMCIVNELCKINIKDILNNGIKKIGIIFNTDPHYKSGEHWVALYVDLDSGIYYFDSYGMKPPKEVEVLMNRIKDQTKKNNKPIETYYNDIQHQRKDSECGVYSMNFIIEFLEGKSFDEIIENIIDDHTMNKKRFEFYRK